jgi:hypothetical protein
MESIKIALSKAVIRMLKPLVRILLHYDIPHGEFSELAKRSYVDVANRYFSLPNRKKTYSRVAVLTGLSRKEVVRVAKINDDEPPTKKSPLNRAARVISGWLRDPDFLDERNEPKTISLKGGSGSFEELVYRYSGDITARAILDELVRVGAVKKIDNDTVKLAHHGYVPEESDPEKIDVLSTCVADLLSTAVHNLNHEANDARFQREVIYSEIPQHVIAEFQQYSHDKSLALLLDLNKWLAEKKRTEKPEPDESTGRVGVGIYYFENDNEGETS